MNAAGSWSSVPNSQWSGVTVLSNASPWLARVLRSVAALATFPPEWDGYKSPAIQQAAVESACRLLTAIEAEDLPVPQACPGPGGGLQIEWRAKNRELELELTPDGQVEFLLVLEGCHMTEGRLSIHQVESVRSLVNWVLQA